MSFACLAKYLITLKVTVFYILTCDKFVLSIHACLMRIISQRCMPSSSRSLTKARGASPETRSASEAYQFRRASNSEPTHKALMKKSLRIPNAFRFTPYENWHVWKAGSIVSWQASVRPFLTSIFCYNVASFTKYIKLDSTRSYVQLLHLTGT
jgi:hypothetical protein